MVFVQEMKAGWKAVALGVGLFLFGASVALNVVLLVVR